MTRFGEISPLWHNFKRFGQIFEGVFSIWQKIILLWPNCDAIGQVSIFVDGQIF